MNKRILIELTENELIVANTGKSFSIANVYSISKKNSSTKNKNEPLSLEEICEIENLYTVKDIQEKEIKVYKENIGRLLSDIKSEEQVSKDYQGRFLWELLQNADDANIIENSKEKYIGEKGLGFKSVLEITENPEIYSGAFNFYFSKTENIKLFKKEFRDKLPAEKIKFLDKLDLIFEIPHEIEEIPKYIENLKKEYATVIVLPLKEGVKEKVKNIINQLKPYQLLFLQNIDEILIKVKNEEKTFFIIKEKRNRGNTQAQIEKCIIEENKNNNSKIYEFLKFSYDFKLNTKNEDKKNSKLYNVSIAIPVVNNEPIFKKDLAESNYLYVFFPTEEKLNFGFLLHATFDIEQNRKHIRRTEGEYEEILNYVGKLIGFIIDYFIEDIIANPKISNDILKIFIPDKEEVSQIQKDLSEKIKEILKEEEFIPALRSDQLVSPLEIKIYKNANSKELTDLIDKNKDIEILDNDKFFSLKLAKPCIDYKKLEVLGSSKVDYWDIVKLFEIIKPKTKDVSLELIRKWIHIYYEYKIDDLKNSKIWWTEDNDVISLNENKLIFLDKLDFKDWIEYKILDGEIKNLISSDENLSEIWKNIQENLPILEKGKKEKITEELLDFLEYKKDDQEWWEKNGYKCLEDLYEFRNYIKEKKVFKWDSNDLFYVPTSEGSWENVAKVYASESWGAYKEFAEFWKNTEDRFLLLDREKWEIEINENNFENWKSFLEKIGVSWIPKVFRKKRNLFHELENYISFLKKYFKISNYKISDLKKADGYYIECFPKCIINLDFKDKINILRKLILDYSNYFEIEIRVARSSYIHVKSFLFWQLKYKKFLKFDREFLLNDDDKYFSLDECYLYEYENLNQWKKILPILDFNWIKNISERAKYIETFKKLSPKTELPLNDIFFWENIINELEKKYNNEKKDLARFIYKKLNEHIGKVKEGIKKSRYGSDKEKQFLENIKSINTELLSTDGNFYTKESICYIDDYRYDNDDLLRDLNIKTFILKLNDAKHYKDLGLKPISKIIEVKNITTSNPKIFEFDGTKDLFILGLKAFFKDKREIHSIEDLKIVVDENFEIEIKIENNIKKISLSYYYDENNKTLYVRDEKEIPYGLTHILNLESNYADNLEKLLSLKSKKELIDYLKRLNISEESLEDIESLEEEKNISTEKFEEENFEVKKQKIKEQSKEIKDEKPAIPNLENFHIKEKISQVDNRREEYERTKSHKPPIESKKDINYQKDKKINVPSSKHLAERGSKQIERKQGKKAEKIIEDKIKEFLESNNLNNKWELTLQENRKDLILRNKESRKEIYFEVKSSKKLNEIKMHISENQIKNIKKHKENFILVCVFGVNENDEITNFETNNELKILWIKNPYLELKEISDKLKLESEFEITHRYKIDEEPENMWNIPSFKNSPKYLRKFPEYKYKLIIKANYKELEKISIDKQILLKRIIGNDGSGSGIV